MGNPALRGNSDPPQFSSASGGLNQNPFFEMASSQLFVVRGGKKKKCVPITAEYAHY
jgi:hypothetical protein